MIRYEADQNYEGIGPVDVIVERDSGETEHLKNYGYHSPDGFQIGYEGSGPADLAYSILVDHMINKFYPTGHIDLAEVRAMVETVHQDFKRDFVAKSKVHFEVNSEEIDKWIEDRG
jgi:hypothetical protein